MVVGHVDGGEIQLLEHVLLHLPDLVPRHVDGVREPESREHLEVQLGEEVAAEIDSSDPERSRHYLHLSSVGPKLLGAGRPSTGWISTAAKNEEMSHFLLIGGKHAGKPETNQFNPRSINLTTTRLLSEIDKLN